jgi:hypothetical protein
MEHRCKTLVMLSRYRRQVIVVALIKGEFCIDCVVAF